MAVHLTILGSGSNGNSAYLETSETRLLVDAGLSGRQIRQRLLALGRAPENLHGILISHEHWDHIQGLAGLAAKLQIPVYCNRLTQQAIAAGSGLRLDFRLFATGCSFEVGDLQVDTFSVPHDAQDPVGFLVHTREGGFGFLTDLGHATKLVQERVKRANVLLLETNHDLRLLQEDTRRPWATKQRIMSRHGHLSNHAAAELASQVVTAGLRHLYLGHLSADCNRPELAYGSISEALRQVGATHVRVETTSQRLASATLTLLNREPTLC